MSADQQSPLVSRSVVLAAMGVLLTQSLAAIWWASGLSSDVNTIKENIRQLRVETYSRAEAQLQFQRLDAADQHITAGMVELKARLGVVESNQSRREDFRRVDPKQSEVRPAR